VIFLFVCFVSLLLYHISQIDLIYPLTLVVMLVVLNKNIAM